MNLLFYFALCLCACFISWFFGGGEFERTPINGAFSFFSVIFSFVISIMCLPSMHEGDGD